MSDEYVQLKPQFYTILNFGFWLSNDKIILGHMAAEDADREMREMAQAEIEELLGRLAKLEEELRALLIPRDPNDDKNVFLEIRAGAGGDEAGLFAADLARMYTKYAERQKWRVEVMDVHPTGIGGFKEAVLLVQGRGAWSRLKFERGVHRVQRVPATESSGRIHTSTVTVASRSSRRVCCCAAISRSRWAGLSGASRALAAALDRRSSSASSALPASVSSAIRTRPSVSEGRSRTRPWASSERSDLLR
jgi:hypothetical protein